MEKKMETTVMGYIEASGLGLRLLRESRVSRMAA